MLLREFAGILLLVMLLAAAALGQSVSVRVETKNVGRAAESYIRVLCTTEIPLSGLRIPLRIGANSDIIIDSVSFQYTIATGNFRLQAEVSDTDREGFIEVIPRITWPIPTFPAVGGEICRIHFHTTMFAADAFVPVDTFFRKVEEGNQTYYEQLEASDAFGTRTIYPSFISGGVGVQHVSPVEDADSQTPKQFSLGQNFPNPFNPSTQLAFSLKQAGRIQLAIYDVAGRCVVILAEGRYSSGEHSVVWDAGSRPSGVYFYRLTTDSGALTRKMLLVK